MPPKPQPAPSVPVAVQSVSSLSCPLWDLYRDGISYSLLAKFKSCRHRFWLYTVCGLREVEPFKASLEYGNLFDTARSAHAATGQVTEAIAAAQAYGQLLRQRWPDLPKTGNNSPEFWTNLFCQQYRVYDAYWSVMEENADWRTRGKQELFTVHYKLPDGRTIPLRGKRDETLEHKNDSKVVTLREDKCKGDPDIQGIQRGLTFEGQTTIYLTSLALEGLQPVQIWYNLLKRPQGDNHALVRRKGREKNVGSKKDPVLERIGEETEEEFIDRIMEKVRADREAYFVRWPVQVTPERLLDMQLSWLQPKLRLLADWWDSIKHDPFNPWASPLHYREAFGQYDPLGDGWRGPYWEFLTSGSQVGLEQITTVFPELEGA